jgi:hypothetical protein
VAWFCNSRGGGGGELRAETERRKKRARGGGCHREQGKSDDAPPKSVDGSGAPPPGSDQPTSGECCASFGERKTSRGKGAISGGFFVKSGDGTTTSGHWREHLVKGEIEEATTLLEPKELE